MSTVRVAGRASELSLGESVNLPTTLSNPDTPAKKLLVAVAITAGGFLVINLGFACAGLVASFVGLFLPGEFESEQGWYPPLLFGTMLLGLYFLTWKVLRSDLQVLFKAMFVWAPLAASYLATALTFLWLPVLGWVFGVALGLCVFAYLWRTRQPWQFFYTAAMVSVMMVSIAISGTEI